MQINYIYVPYVDLGLLAISIALIVIMYITFIKKNSRFKLVLGGIFSMTLATIFSMLYNFCLNNIQEINNYIIYFTHDAFYGELILLFLLFDIYMYSLIEKPQKKEKTKKFTKIMFFIYGLYILAETISDFTHFGFYIDNKVAYEHYILNPFILFYAIYAIIGIIIVVLNMKNISKRIFYEVLFLFPFCISIMFAQSFYNTTTFNTLSFFIPVMSIFILLHNNGYDANTGTLGLEAFEEYIKSLIHKNETFSVITITLIKDKEDNDIDINATINQICHYCDYTFKDALLFEKNKEKINIITKINDKDILNKNINNLFETLYSIFNNKDYSFKITILNYPDNIINNNIVDVIKFNKYLINITPLNEVYFCQTKDKVFFTKNTYILQELKDIKIKNDLNDSRVIVYCQPIFDCVNKKFFNAETLMRLNLPELGIVMPNDFIPIAEEYNLIHQLSLIILNKTCKNIKNILDLGYDIDRISVNFSAAEITDKNFINEIKTIIESNNVPFNKLSFEITETTFNNIELLEKNMYELRKLGIIFYLDDFGTGYSNIDRISMLPFTTIKFDRSLLMSVFTKESAKQITIGLVNIFKKLNFHILFEGIENETDEMFCIENGARYLQGFKYSKPIEIENLTKFLTK